MHLNLAQEIVYITALIQTPKSVAIFCTSGIKGGSGRSTVACQFAIWLSRSQDVLLVDADEQETASDFTAWREQHLGETRYTLINLTGANLRKQIEQLRPKYDHIVIDTGGRDTTSQRAALFVADVAIVPFQPRSHDVWTLSKLVEMLDEIQATRAAPLTVLSFLNRADITSADNRESAEALASYPQLGFLPLQLKNRKAYPNAASKGLGVGEMDPIDIKAVQESEALFQALFSHARIPSPAAS